MVGDNLMTVKRIYNDMDLIKLTSLLNEEERAEFHLNTSKYFCEMISNDEFNEYTNNLYTKLLNIVENYRRGFFPK
jgi:hypothetical protein